ncbi:ATP-binding protein [Azospirillum sp. CT11-132]|uniref:ATP-binding protein n=1 Tax=unclassified Azospirillum TaxID=2630922 RepID=UPI000D6206C0|nr:MULTISPECIES: ATP-binding protein [unclassified Azospirillum]PWC55319.1 histidine kinase [Azospirillum sp. TSH7]PWC66385.1 histidine kinase [Azospirillum sp. TSH20]
MNRRYRAGGRTAALPVIVIAGLFLSLSAFLLVRSATSQAEHALADRQAIQLHDELKASFEHQSVLLRALSGPLAGPAPVTDASFASAAEPLLPLYPNLRAVAWARRISKRNVPLLERAMRSAGYSSFAVRNADGGSGPEYGRGPEYDTAGMAADRFVNVLAEPQSAAGLIGLDMASLSGQRDVLVRSCAANRLVAAEGEPLRANLGENSVLLYLPVYTREVEDDPGRLVEPIVCDLLTGFLWTSFDIGQLLRDAVRRVGLSIGDVYLLEPPVRPDMGVPRMLAAEGAIGRPGELPHPPVDPLTVEQLTGDAAPHAIVRDIAFAGRVWRLYVLPDAARLFSADDRLAWTMLIGGILLTAGVAAYVLREARTKRLLRTEARARAAMARALRESEERFRLALRYSKVTLFSQDCNLRHLWIYCPRTDLHPERMIGRTDAELFPADEAARMSAIKRSVIESGIGTRCELEVTYGGSRRVLDLSVEPMRDETGAVAGVVCAAIDMTESVEIREALSRAHADAERANQAKSRFLAAASHDLRQPFQAMSLFHHILMSKLDDPQQVEVANKLGEALTAGNTLLSTLLDTSALEVGNVKPRVAEFDVQDILARLSVEIGDQAIDRGLQLRTVDCSARVQSDPILLERMVRNLLVNALRYTTEGRILLGCRRRSDADGGFRLSIEVWDTGPGIAEAEMAAIFEDFYRCGTDQRDSGRGLGLGLSIVRRMSQMLDHPVTVRSQVGRGTVFAVSVPLVEQRCHCSAAAE